MTELYLNTSFLPMVQIISEEEKKAESHAEAQKRKKETKANAVKNSKAGQGSTVDPNQPEFTKMDIRVGFIQKVSLSEIEVTYHVCVFGYCDDFTHQYFNINMSLLC